MIEYNKFMDRKSNSKYDLEDRLIEFAVRIIDLAEALPGTVASKNLGSQIVRSGTSPALNYAEAQSAESKNDFVHKMKICLKELRENAHSFSASNLPEDRTPGMAQKAFPDRSSSFPHPFHDLANAGTADYFQIIKSRGQFVYRNFSIPFSGLQHANEAALRIEHFHVGWLYIGQFEPESMTRRVGPEFYFC
jgi:four helix bundle protein